MNGRQYDIYIVTGALILCMLFLIRTIDQNTQAQNAVFQSNKILIEGAQYCLSTQGMAHSR